MASTFSRSSGGSRCSQAPLAGAAGADAAGSAGCGAGCDALAGAGATTYLAARDQTIAWLTKKGIEVQPGSQANMFMVNWKKPAKDVQTALLAEKVQIGRSWAIWPNVSRVTVGSASDMAAFRAAVDKVYKA